MFHFYHYKSLYRCYSMYASVWCTVLFVISGIGNKNVLSHFISCSLLTSFECFVPSKEQFFLIPNLFVRDFVLFATFPCCLLHVNVVCHILHHIVNIVTLSLTTTFIFLFPVLSVLFPFLVLFLTLDVLFEVVGYY